MTKSAFPCKIVFIFIGVQLLPGRVYAVPAVTGELVRFATVRLVLSPGALAPPVTARRALPWAHQTVQDAIAKKQ